MAKLLIKRNSEWANKMRPFDLYLNGIKIAEIKDKQLLSFEIPEGKYQLIAKVDWCGSKPLNFQIKKEETRRIELTGFMFSKYFLPFSVFIILIYVGIYVRFGINSLILATVIMFLFGYFTYFLSFGRNQYLRLKEI